MPDLSVVIVSWNVCDLLRECVHSVRQSGAESGLAIEIIVVDSASTDQTVAMLRAEFPEVRVIEPGTNVGFSKGNNLGLEAASAEYVFLLNPDTKVLNDALGRMVAHLKTHADVGVLGPKVLNEDGTVQSSRRRFPTLWTAMFESTWLQGLAPKRVLNRYTMLDHNDDERIQVDWVLGAAMLVRRVVIEQVGGMDEGFFMYSEELDWQKRIREAGWQISYGPEAQIIHYGGRSSDQVVAQRHIHFQTSKVRYFRKHHGRVAGALVRTVLLANYVWQLALEWLKGLVGHKRALRRERVRAYWQVLRSGLKGS